MSNIDDKRDVYTKVFKFIIDNNIDTIPVSHEKLADILNVELIPLSDLIKAGFKERDIFRIWGNNDGVVNCYVDKQNKQHYKITYNDLSSGYRKRFTIMEELSHIILGHTDDTDFNLFNQCYEQSKYNTYDEDARICAGFLLLSPMFYFTYQRDMPIKFISDICKISETCAHTRCDIYNKFKLDIINHPLFWDLPLPTVDRDYELLPYTAQFVQFIEFAKYNYVRQAKIMLI